MASLVVFFTGDSLGFCSVVVFFTSSFFISFVKVGVAEVLVALALIFFSDLFVGSGTTFFSLVSLTFFSFGLSIFFSLSLSLFFSFDFSGFSIFFSFGFSGFSKFVSFVSLFSLTSIFSCFSTGFFVLGFSIFGFSVGGGDSILDFSSCLGSSSSF